jgi:ribose transport system substrate-binding protein
MVTRFALAFALPVFLFASCSDSSDATPKSGSKTEPVAGSHKKLRIAVIPKGTSHEFWKSVEKGARKADAELADVEIVWKGPTGEGNATQQIQIVESFLAESYDAICLAPLDARALETPVKQAISKKVPVVIFDSGLATADIPITSYVATNNFHGGEMAADHLASILGEKGNVILIPYNVGSESTEQREKGFLSRIAKYPNIKILSSDKHGGPDESHAIEVSENLFATFGDKVNGIFCSNESSTSGLLTVLRRDTRGLAGQVKVVGFDSSANIVNGLSDNVLQGVILQDPVRMGYESVKAARAKCVGEAVQARVETGETLVTPQNMKEPRNHELLFPLEGK